MRVPVAVAVLSLTSALAGSVAADVVMKGDGKSLQCILDREQGLTFSGPDGEVVVKMGDVVWIAGGAKKKARVRGTRGLLSSDLTTATITYYESEKDREKGKRSTIAGRSVLFLMPTDRVEVAKGRKLRIEESGGELMVTVETVPTKDFFVELVPENWSSTLEIVEPEGPAAMSNRAELTVKAKIRGDRRAMESLVAEPAPTRHAVASMKTASAHVWTSSGLAELTKEVRTRLDAPPAADVLEVATTLELGRPFHMEFNGQIVHSVTGTGSFLVYLEGGAIEHFAQNRLQIEDTLSNVVQLSVTLSE